jgi:acyl-CoA hydrolase
MDVGVVRRFVAGHAIDAGFFVGPDSLYQRLRAMPRAQRDRINMTSVKFINDAHRDFEAKNRDRAHARFVNNGMKATLLGAVVSDGLDNGQVVSGVGGQYDFVRQAFALDNARAIIMINAVRDGSAGPESNIVWNYAHETIPRHLRDIIVTEYGVADLRGKSDVDVIAAMLSVADKRFQAGLIEKAKSAGKLPKEFNMPETALSNCPERIDSVLRAACDKNLLPDYPFGTDFTEAEQTLLPALDRLKKASSSKAALVRLALEGALSASPDEQKKAALERMKLAYPRGFKERFYRYLVRGALRS